MGFLVYLIVGVICGFITKSMNESKGYDGGFLWGFLLTIIGIIVVAVRPYAPTSNHSNYGKTSGSSGKTFSTSYDTAQPLKAAPNMMAYCISCKHVFVDEQYGRCPKCGNYSTVKTNVSERDWNLHTEEWKLEKKSEWFGIDFKKDFAPAFKERIKGTEFEQYLPLLEKNNLLEPALLLSLTSDELKEIGIESLGDRKKLLAFIKEFNLNSNEKKTEKKATENHTQVEQEPKDDDWICPKCGERNRSYVVTCPGCLNRRPK